MPKAAALPIEQRRALAHVIRQNISAKGLTLEAVATRAGISRAAISHWLRLENDPQIGALYSVEDALGLRWGSLISEAEKYLRNSVRSA